MTPNLIELVSRIEAASGPDRELDADIALTQGWARFAGDNWCGRTGSIVVPAYTASLDAAMSLVPEGIEGLPLSLKVERFYLGNGVSKCRASVWCGLGAVSSLDTASEAASLALALCAAALRSRSLTDEER